MVYVNSGGVCDSGVFAVVFSLSDGVFLVEVFGVEAVDWFSGLPAWVG